MTGLLVVGTLLVDEVLTLAAPAVPGSQQRARTRQVTGGGQVWHTARAAARAGAVVTVAGRRGDDGDGRALAQALDRAGVRDRLLAAGTSRRAVVLLAPPLERAIVSVGGDGPWPDVDPSPLARDLVTGSARVHLDGFALDDACGPLALAVAAAAARSGVPVSLEPPSPDGLPARRDRIRALPALDLVVGRPDEVVVTRGLLTAPPRVVVEHDGPHPVRWSGPEATVTVPVPGAVPVDTLGAGDRFTGGLLAALLVGLSTGRPVAPADALAAGIAAAHAAALP